MNQKETILNDWAELKAEFTRFQVNSLRFSFALLNGVIRRITIKNMSKNLTKLNHSKSQIFKNLKNIRKD